MTAPEFNSLRKPFLQTLTKLARQDKKVIFIIGDVGWSYVDGYIKEFPNQFLNAGAGEQNMMNVAVGFANEGWKPYVYTMVNFICFRPYEQVRNNIAYGNANVKLFGVKGSEAYKFLGMSHNIYDVEEKVHTLNPVRQEDQQLMDHLPNLKTYYPKTEEAVEQIMLAEYEREGPAYMRI